jgi:hypothetical protein
MAYAPTFQFLPLFAPYLPNGASKFNAVHHRFIPRSTLHFYVLGISPTLLKTLKSKKITNPPLSPQLTGFFHFRECSVVALDELYKPYFNGYTFPQLNTGNGKVGLYRE